MIRKRSFDPVVNESTRILVLGSLPGDTSITRSQYYGHPQNRFWQLISEVINVDLLSLNYDARLTELLNNRIGLWDVIADAERVGSLDTNIRNRRSNDLVELLTQLPNLTTIAFNGGTSARLGLQILHEHADRYRIFRLPSSSPAHTMTYSEKLRAWLALKEMHLVESNGDNAAHQ